MEAFIIISLFFLTISGIEFQYIYNILTKPAGMVYLGTVHFPSDYFYYLSQMVQGKSHILTSTILFTSEKLTPVWVGWQMVATGRIFHILGIEVSQGYSIAVGVYILLFLILAYLLIRLIFPNDRGRRIMAFFFFISANSLFYLNFTKSGPELSSFWYWYNLGNFFARFGPTPHHLLANSFLTLLVIILVLWFEGKGRKIFLIPILTISTIALTSISPVYWGLLVASAFGAPFFFKLFRASDFKKYFSSQKMEILLVPFWLMVFFGLPAALYVKKVFSMEPYVYSAVWEAGQQVRLNILWLIKGSGLIIVFGFMGLFPFLKRTNVAGVLAVFILAAASFFHLSGLPELLRLTNMRFWPSSVYIIWGVLAAEGIFFICGEFGRNRKKVFVLLMIIYLISILPTYFLGFQETVVQAKKNVSNAYYYLGSDAYAAYKEAERDSPPNSVFLVEWPFNESFPALTGRKSFFGFSLLTINEPAKKKKTFDFFGGNMDEPQAKTFLQYYKIDYILGYSWHNQLNNLPFLEKLYANNILGVYKVDKGSL